MNAIIILIGITSLISLPILAGMTLLYCEKIIKSNSNLFEFKKKKEKEVKEKVVEKVVAKNVMKNPLNKMDSYLELSNENAFLREEISRLRKGYR